MIKDYLGAISSTMKGSNGKLDIWVLLIVFLRLLLGTHSLKNVQVIVPNTAKIHDTVALQCKYDLEEQPLYTVKWYKGVHEFFRYVPQEDLNMRIFHIPGVKVDLSRSSSNEIVLLDVQSEATGKYSCEVLTDEPFFYTLTSSGFMYVVDIPQEAPIMEIDNYNNTGTIKARCTTPPSFPAMNVSWYINGIKVNESGRRSVSLDPYSKNRQTRLMTISLMQKDINDNVFQGGIIKVQCLSTLFDLYKSEDVRYIEDNRTQPWPSSVIEAIENSTGSSALSIWACTVAVLSVMASR